MNQETEIISNLNSINVKLTKTNDQLEHLRWQSYDINTPIIISILLGMICGVSLEIINLLRQILDRL